MAAFVLLVSGEDPAAHHLACRVMPHSRTPEGWQRQAARSASCWHNAPADGTVPIRVRADLAPRVKDFYKALLSHESLDGAVGRHCHSHSDALLKARKKLSQAEVHHHASRVKIGNHARHDCFSSSPFEGDQAGVAVLDSWGSDSESVKDVSLPGDGVVLLDSQCVAVASESVKDVSLPGDGDVLVESQCVAVVSSPCGDGSSLLTQILESDVGQPALEASPIDTLGTQTEEWHPQDSTPCQTCLQWKDIAGHWQALYSASCQTFANPCQPFWFPLGEWSVGDNLDGWYGEGESHNSGPQDRLVVCRLPIPDDFDSKLSKLERRAAADPYQNDMASAWLANNDTQQKLFPGVVTSSRFGTCSDSELLSCSEPGVQSSCTAKPSTVEFNIATDSESEENSQDLALQVGMGDVSLACDRDIDDGGSEGVAGVSPRLYNEANDDVKDDGALLGPGEEKRCDTDLEFKTSGKQSLASLSEVDMSNTADPLIGSISLVADSPAQASNLHDPTSTHGVSFAGAVVEDQPSSACSDFALTPVLSIDGVHSALVDLRNSGIQRLNAGQQKMKRKKAEAALRDYVVSLEHSIGSMVQAWLINVMRLDFWIVIEAAMGQHRNCWTRQKAELAVAVAKLDLPDLQQRHVVEMIDVQLKPRLQHFAGPDSPLHEYAMSLRSDKADHPLAEDSVRQHGETQNLNMLIPAEVPCAKCVAPAGAACSDYGHGRDHGQADGREVRNVGPVNTSEHNQGSVEEDEDLKS